MVIIANMVFVYVWIKFSKSDWYEQFKKCLMIQRSSVHEFIRSQIKHR